MRRVLLITYVVGLVLTVPDRSIAADAKYQSGNVCVAEAAGGGYTPLGEIGNNDVTLNLWVNCALQHDDTTSNDYQLRVHVFDGHASEAIECDSFIRDFSVPTLVATAADASSGTGYDLLNLDVSSSDSSSYYYFRCLLPDWQGSPSIGTSYVANWWIKEI